MSSNSSTSSSASTTSGAPIPECCLTGYKQQGTTVGDCLKICGGSVDCYYSAPPPSSSPCPTIVILADIFGWSFINSRLIADGFAKRGFHVYLPDCFAGEAVDGASLAVMDEPEPDSFFGTVSQNCRWFVSIFGAVPVIFRHGDSVSISLIQRILEDIRARIPALNGINKIGAVGYCWGARYTILNAGGASPLVDCYAVCHPSNVEVPKDIEALSTPGLFILAENDMVFSKSAEATTRQIIARRAAEPGGAKVAAEFHTFPGTKHGFAVRGPPEVKAQRDAANEKVAAFFAVQLAGVATATATTTATTTTATLSAVSDPSPLIENAAGSSS